MATIEEEFHEYVRKYAITYKMTEEEALDHACVRGFHEYLMEKQKEAYDDDRR